jgi:hypothetical protein
MGSKNKNYDEVILKQTCQRWPPQCHFHREKQLSTYFFMQGFLTHCYTNWEFPGGESRFCSFGRSVAHESRKDLSQGKMKLIRMYHRVKCSAVRAFKEFEKTNAEE